MVYGNSNSGYLIGITQSQYQINLNATVLCFSGSPVYQLCSFDCAAQVTNQSLAPMFMCIVGCSGVLHNISVLNPVVVGDTSYILGNTNSNNSVIDVSQIAITSSLKFSMF